MPDTSLKEKARQWNNDPDIKSMLAEIVERNSNGSSQGKFEKGNAESLLAQEFDRASLASKGLQYERLDQLTIDILLGVR